MFFVSTETVLARITVFLYRKIYFLPRKTVFFDHILLTGLFRVIPLRLFGDANSMDTLVAKFFSDQKQKTRLAKVGLFEVSARRQPTSVISRDAIRLP